MIDATRFRASGRHAKPDTVYPILDQPERGGAIESLNREVLIKRSLEISSTGFMTIVSIIQGVALALLAENTFEKPSPLSYLQSFSLLLVFVAVFYTYVNVSIMLRWAPSFLDCLLPFAIAAMEIPPAFFLGNVVAWNSWLAVLWLCAAGGFYITIKWSPPSHFGSEREAHRLLHVMLRELQLTAATCGILMAVLGFFAAVYPHLRPVWGVGGALVILGTIATFVMRVELRSSQIHRRYGVNRPPFN